MKCGKCGEALIRDGSKWVHGGDAPATHYPVPVRGGKRPKALCGSGHDWKRHADGRLVCRTCAAVLTGEWAEQAYRAVVRARFEVEVAREHAEIVSGPADGQATLSGGVRRQGRLGEERCCDCGAVIPGVRVPADVPEIAGSMMCAACARAEGLPTWDELFGGGGAA